jgi:hypothetical protein
VKEAISVDGKETGCGAGPFKTLSIDEQKRIVGGTEAIKNSWPAIVSLLVYRIDFNSGYKSF